MKLVLEMTPLTAAEMIEREKNGYNPQVWEEKVRRYDRPDTQFFVVPANETWQYERYFVAYKADGILFFSSFGYSSSLTSAGFRMCMVLDNKLYVQDFLFPDGQGGFIPARAENNAHNREIFRKKGIRVTTCF